MRSADLDHAGSMLVRTRTPGVLEVWDGSDAAPVDLPWGDLGEPSSLRWCTAASEVLVCAPKVGAASSEYRGRYRPQERAYRIRPGQTDWDELSAVYATDAVCVQSGGYALYRGGGVQFLDSAGNVVRDTGSAPRFSGSPSRLSSNYRGDRVAWIRDSRRIQVETPQNPDVSFRSRTSAYGYGWWDDAALVYFFGSGLHLLDLESGKSRTLKLDLADLILPDPAEASALQAHMPKLGPGSAVVDIDDLRVTRQDMWLLARIRGRDNEGNVRGLFQLQRSSRRLTLHASAGEGQGISAFAVTTDSSAVVAVSTYEGVRRIRSELAFTGPSSQLLRDGWRPAPDCTTPTFFSSGVDRWLGG